MSLTTTVERTPAPLPATPATPAPTVDPGQRPSPGAAPEPVEKSYDDIEFEKAMADAAAMEAAEKAGAGGTGSSPPAPAGVSGATGSAPAAAPGAVPLPRFNSVVQQRNQAVEDAAYWRGVAESRAAGGATGAPPAPVAQPTPAEILAQVEAAITERQNAIVALAEKHDNGEITLAQYEREKFKIQNEIDGIKARHLAGHIQSQMPKEKPAPISWADQVALDNLIADLQVKHPWSAVMPQVELQWLADLAREELTGRGIELVPGSARSMAAIYEAAAQLSDFFGPRWHPNSTLPAPAATPSVPAVAGNPSTAVATTTAPGIPPGVRQAQVEAKIGLAARHPPNSATMGSSGGVPAADLTDEQIEAMSADELAALPGGTLERLFSRQR